MRSAPASGRPYFFYGTLLDPDLRARLIGPGRPARPAVLRGFRRVGVRGADYPMLRPAAGAAVAGILVHGIDAAAAARLAAYEGPDYRLALRPVAPRGGAATPALVFLPGPGLAAGGRPWDLARWRRAAKPRVLAALRAGR